MHKGRVKTLPYNRRCVLERQMIIFIFDNKKTPLWGANLSKNEVTLDRFSMYSESIKGYFIELLVSNIIG